jgi:CheY-like chemotaxis protein
MKSLRILIVDDHEVVRRGLRSLLSSRPDWEICGEAADGRAAVDQANSLRPDVILMDVSMPDMSGTQAAKILHKELPETQVVIISQNEPEITRRQAIEAGAAAYVAKSDLDLIVLPIAQTGQESGMGVLVERAKPVELNHLESLGLSLPGRSVNALPFCLDSTKAHTALGMCRDTLPG